MEFVEIFEPDVESVPSSWIWYVKYYTLPGILGRLPARRGVCAFLADLLYGVTDSLDLLELSERDASFGHDENDDDDEDDEGNDDEPLSIVVVDGVGYFFLFMRWPTLTNLKTMGEQSPWNRPSERRNTRPYCAWNNQKQNHTEQTLLYCTRPIWRSNTIDDVDVVYHFMGWQHAGTRGQNVDIPSVPFPMIRSFRSCCIDAWNPFTVSCRSIYAGSLL